MGAEVSKKPRKFQMGAVVPDVRLAVALIHNGEWLYVNNKPQHPAWLASMTLHTIRLLANQRRLRLAIRNEEAK